MRYYCSEQIKENEMGEASITDGEMRNVTRFYSEKPGGKQQLGRP
jgi:hypothetical protein